MQEPPIEYADASEWLKDVLTHEKPIHVLLLELDTLLAKATPLQSTQDQGQEPKGKSNPVDATHAA